jgi:3D-(3,5/4)-trihydroxycyclohexane-1,2-dione acylhydrolase (decyclizing)
LDGEVLPIDFAANAASLGAHVIKAASRDELADAIQTAQQMAHTVCIVIETDRRQRVDGYESWWDVAVAEVSTNPEVQKAREDYDQVKPSENYFL